MQALYFCFLPRQTAGPVSAAYLLFSGFFTGSPGRTKPVFREFMRKNGL
jgi:hypothetical protein